MYKVVDMEGAVICTGVEAENEDSALDQFFADHPVYAETPDFFYATEEAT